MEKEYIKASEYAKNVLYILELFIAIIIMEN